MPQRRSERMQLVVDLALNAETQAAKNLSEAQAMCSAEQQRLQDIQDYYSNYEKLFAERRGQLRASDLAGTRDFLVNLSSACQHQQRQVGLAQQRMEDARQLWRHSHLKSDSLGDFQHRCVNEEQKHDDKKEQAVMDDLSSRAKPH